MLSPPAVAKRQQGFKRLTNAREDLLQSLLSESQAVARNKARLVLEPLYAYDTEHGGDLVRTLLTYLRTGCNASRAAENLYLHRSGLLYRLGRIEALLGVRLDHFETRVALEIAALSLDSQR